VGQKAYVAPVRAEDAMIEAAITDCGPGSAWAAGRWTPFSSSPTGRLARRRLGNGRRGRGRSRAQRHRAAGKHRRRPAGTVVYVAEEGTARQRVVQPGVQTEGWVEILEGLAAGEAVVTSGAGF